MSEVARRVEHVVAPLLARDGFELVDVVFTGGTLRVFVDRAGGIDLDTISDVSARLSRLLDEDDPIPSSYTLEVSSPGLERPLRTPEHFRRFVGRRARVRTRGAHEGRRSFSGELLGATDSEVTVAADTGVVSIAYADIQRSNLLGD